MEGRERFQVEALPADRAATGRMAMHAQGTRVHRGSAARAPHPATQQGRQQVRPAELRQCLRPLQPAHRGQGTRATTRAAACLDLVADLLPALLLIALLVAGSGLFVVTFDYS
jgi:hypothetical protein